MFCDPLPLQLLSKNHFFSFFWNWVDLPPSYLDNVFKYTVYFFDGTPKDLYQLIVLKRLETLFFKSCQNQNKTVCARDFSCCDHKGQTRIYRQLTRMSFRRVKSNKVDRFYPELINSCSLIILYARSGVWGERGPEDLLSRTSAVVN